MAKRSCLVYFWIILCFNFASSKIVIRDIIGPSWVEVDSESDFVLDCDYVASSDESNVVVKWFYNGLEEQIYQWIADPDYVRKPSIVGHRFANHIDTNYNVQDNGKISYRALNITNIDPTLSGNYTCKVTSDFSEHVMTKQVVVYSPAVTFQIYYLELDEIIVCDATSVAPKPEFHIAIVGTNGTNIEIPSYFDYIPQEVSDDNVYYNMSILLSYNSSLLPEENVLFMCRINIPGTNYTEEKSVEQLSREQSELTESLDSILKDLGDTLDNITLVLNSTYEDIATLEANDGNHHWPSLLLSPVLIFSIFLLKY